jgi:parallel beta-helix repeat protein
MVRRRLLCGWVAMLIFAGVASAVEPGNPDEKNVMKFDPSFEKSLWGVQDSKKWKIAQTLHVNPASKAADDKGPGTAEQPLKTISRAVELAKPGTRVLIHPGVYREGVSLHRSETLDQSGTAEAPIVIEGQEPGKVILSGADVWSEWHSEGAEVYSAPWPYKWGSNGNGWNVKPLGQRSEMVFFDDQMLRQVLKRDELASSTFFVDESGGRLYIRPPDGQRTQQHRIEVTVRESGLNVGDLWSIEDLPGYIAVRGLTFRHFVRHAFLGRHVLLEDCRFEWNNDGLGIGGEDYVVRRNVAVHNGGRTMFIPPRGGVPGMPAAINSVHLNGLIEDNTASYGNWRLGGYGKLYAWATAGTKVHTLSNLIIRRHTVQFNECPGIWADTKCSNLLIEDCRITNNRRAGIWIEICGGDTVVRNNIVAFNVTGFCLSHSSHVTIQGNTFYGNEESQIGHWHKRRGRGGYRSAYLKILDNRFVAATPKQGIIVLPGFDYLPELSTVANNLYYSPGAEVFNFGGQKMDFAAWQAKMRDKGSIFADPIFRDPEALDFTPKPGSPLLRR